MQLFRAWRLCSSLQSLLAPQSVTAVTSLTPRSVASSRISVLGFFVFDVQAHRILPFYHTSTILPFYHQSANIIPTPEIPPYALI